MKKLFTGLFLWIFTIPAMGAYTPTYQPDSGDPISSSDFKSELTLISTAISNITTAEIVNSTITDFPNLPYAWDREIKQLVRQNLPEETLTRILGQNALEFYQIDLEKN